MVNVLVIGAHPDDAEIKSAGTAKYWTAAGVSVTFVSVTDGRAGHHQMAPEDLAKRRDAESRAAARRLGIRSINLGLPDGELVPSLDARRMIIRLIRECQADLVLTHRTNDYHPDHRAAAELVRDAAYLVTVPSVVPEVACLPRNPVFGYLSDRFQKPCPFSADILVPIDSVLDDVVESLACHESQFFEWLPYNMGILGEIPADPVSRLSLLKSWYVENVAVAATEFSGRVTDPAVRFLEAFEISEYGSPLTKELREKLFPFNTY